MSSPKTILVTGATGKQGGAVISAILSQSTPSTPYHIFAVTRDTSSPSAQRLSSNENITLLQGDLSNPHAFFTSLSGTRITTVFSVQTNTDAEETQGKALIDASLHHGVKQFIYSSGDRGGPAKSEVGGTYVKNFQAKYSIEKYLQSACSSGNMVFTILRPVTFFENVTEDLHGKGFSRMWEQMGTKKLQMIAVSDIGFFAASAFFNEEEWKDRAMSLAGDELTQKEANEVFRKVTGRDMILAPCIVGKGVKAIKKDTVGDMFRWFEEVGYGADVQGCRELNPGMLDWEGWVRGSWFGKDGKA